MFDLAHMKQVKWPVALVDQQPDGTFVDVEIHATFERLVGTELADFRRSERELLMQQIQRSLSGAGKAVDAEVTEKEIADADAKRRALLLSKLKGWGEGIVDGDTPVPYSPAVADALMDIKPVFDAFWKALVACSENARPKTSPPLPAGSVAVAQT